MGMSRICIQFMGLHVGFRVNMVHVGTSMKPHCRDIQHKEDMTCNGRCHEVLFPFDGQYSLIQETYWDRDWFVWVKSGSLVKRSLHDGRGIGSLGNLLRVP